MIRVPRALPPPPILTDERARAAKIEAHRHFRLPTSTSQERFDFDASLWRSPEVVDTLSRLFRGKCAYCESPLTSGDSDLVDHFRPTANTKDPFGGKSYRDRYFWLAYEWSNLYAACRTCLRNHANQFPIAGPVADVGDDGHRLLRELPLLLDPCEDVPERYLQVMDNGLLMPRPERGRDRGDATIRVLGLNRSDMVTARRLVISETRARWRRYAESSRGLDALTETLGALLNPGVAYLLVRRHALANAAQKDGVSRTLFSDALRAVEVADDWLSFLWPEQKEPVNAFLARQQAEHEPSGATSPPPTAAVDIAGLEPPPEDTSPGAPPEPAAVPSAEVQASSGSAAYIERIEIRNFRAIRSLVLTLPKEAPKDVVDAPTSGSDRPPPQPWLVLLGENGTGKSSVLHALSYALMGRELAKPYLREPQKLLRRPPAPRPGSTLPPEPLPRWGSVKVTLSTHVIQFSFSAKKVRWKHGEEGAGVFLRAYGSTRLLPLPEHPRDNPAERVRVENLFNPFEPLNDADRWLGDLDRLADSGGDDPPPDSEPWRARQKFDAAALAIKDLLPRAENLRLDRDDALGLVLIDQENVAIPLHQLSDGYQTVIALAADIMAGVPDQESDFATRAGLVLLDELGTHLHPRWRMEIVRGLRRAFPSLQFIATTHEPLCLRGLGTGEVVVMKREEGVMRTLTNLPSPQGLRVDQLLTSPYFGLLTTIDPALDERFREYYDLVARNGALPPKQEKRRDELRLELQPHRVLGYTRRDQLMAEVMDEYFAKELRAVDPQKLREKTKQRLAELWAQAAPAGRPDR